MWKATKTKILTQVNEKQSEMNKLKAQERLQLCTFSQQLVFLKFLDCMKVKWNVLWEKF